MQFFLIDFYFQRFKARLACDKNGTEKRYIDEKQIYRFPNDIAK